MHKAARVALAVTICLAAALPVLAVFARAPGQSVGAAAGDMARVVWHGVLLPGENARHQVNYRNWVNSLLTATPILLTGLAVTVAFRAAVWNIGAQGQYLGGAILGAALGIYWRAPGAAALPALLLAAMIGGAAVAMVAAALQRWRGVNVVLGTLMLNFVAMEGLRFLLVGPMRESGGQPQSEQVREAARLPTLGHTPLHAGFFLALAAAAVVAFVLRRTTWGFRLRAVGENPVAARFAGINVPAVSMAALCLSGALAGLAGGVQVSGVQPYQLLLDTGASGFGFTGIAAALLGGLTAGGVVAAAVLLGVLDTAFAALQPCNVPYVAGQAMQGAILIAVLILTRPWKMAK